MGSASAQSSLQMRDVEREDAGGSLLPGVVLMLSGAGDICELQPWGRHAAQLIRLRPQSKCSAFTLLQFVLIASFCVHERASGPGRRSQVRVHQPTEMATCYWSEAETPVSVRDASCPSPMRHPRDATKASSHIRGVTWGGSAGPGGTQPPQDELRLQGQADGAQLPERRDEDYHGPAAVHMFHDEVRLRPHACAGLCPSTRVRPTGRESVCAAVKSDLEIWIMQRFT